MTAATCWLRPNTATLRSYEVATGRWRLPENPTGEAKPRLYFSLFSDGQNKMASFVPTNVPIAMRRALEKAGLGSDDIDYFVFHQPAPFLVKAWAEGIGARPGAVPTDDGRYRRDDLRFHPAHPDDRPARGQDPPRRSYRHGRRSHWLGFAAQVWQLGEVLVC